MHVTHTFFLISYWLQRNELLYRTAGKLASNSTSLTKIHLLTTKEAERRVTTLYFGIDHTSVYAQDINAIARACHAVGAGRTYGYSAYVGSGWAIWRLCTILVAPYIYDRCYSEKKNVQVSLRRTVKNCTRLRYLASVLFLLPLSMANKQNKTADVFLQRIR